MRSVTEVGYLDPEIAGEGQAVELGNENINYAPPVKPIIPDLSTVKSLRKYFAPYRFRPFPTWIYHPTEAARIVKDAKEAKQYGVVYRKATEEERFKYHAPPEFYASEGEWRTDQYPKDTAFDPERLQPGKTFVPRIIDQAKAQTQLLEVLARGQGGAVANAEVEALKTQVAKMQALLEQLTAPRDIKSTVEPEVTVEAHKNALEDIFDPEVRMQSLRNEAERLGIDVDGRWSEKRLQQEIDKASH